MNKKLIWAVCKDVGGMNGILPVVRRAREMGAEVILFGTGKAKEMLAGKEGFSLHDNFIPVDTLETAMNVGLLRGFPLVLLTSMCSDGGVGRDLVPELSKLGANTVALQDYWGARLWTDWSEPKYRPDFICVNDKTGRNIVLDAWKRYGSERVKITGFPALDRCAGYSTKKATARVRTSLAMPDDVPIIFYGVESVKGTGKAFLDFVDILNNIGRKICLVVSMHPSLRDTVPGELPECEQAMRNFTAGVLVRNLSKVDFQSWIAGSDVVVAMYSTILIEAAMLGKQNISVLYPEIGMARFKEAMAGKINESTIVSLGASAKAENPSELRALLLKSFMGELGLKKAQADAFKIDGRNAERVAKFIMKLK